MKLVGPIRKQLGIRTVFNQLGPLVNPASARFQVLGVYDPHFLRPTAEALGILNAQEAWVVHGQDGLDEVSPRARTSYARVVEGRVVEGELLPQDFGIEPVPESALAPGETLAQSAAILREAISDADSDRFRAVLLARRWRSVWASRSGASSTRPSWPRRPCGRAGRPRNWTTSSR